jgi:hypothetical protein
VQNMSANPDIKEVILTSAHYRAEASNDPKFYINGNLHGGQLSFEVVAALGTTKGPIQGHEFFEAMLAHFGNKVKMISAVWSDARPEFTTNLEIFNAETKARATRENAAFATKTGKWAKAAGFSMIQSIDTTPDDLPGGYEQVLVDFVKPPRTTRARKRK